MQIASALDYLHGCTPPIVHGDIKGGNILIDDDGQACVTDFGISTIAETTGLTSRTIAGTLRYMAPELIYDVPGHGRSRFVTRESDVWAFGMTMFEVLTDLKP